jgi:outer membrane protein OmpA-like peptidoglycan-associated protein
MKQIYKLLILFPFLIQITPLVIAQNLVPNAGFEAAWSCPEDFTKEPVKELVPYWRNPNHGTPDYFNRCSNEISGIPGNFAGNMEAAEGNAYIGLILREVFKDSLNEKKISREYIEVELREPLKFRQLYCFNLKYCLASKSEFSVDALGVSFTREKLKAWNFGLLDAEPMVFNIPGNKMDNKLEWREMCGVFRARGRETYLTIGNFVPNVQTHYFENVDTLCDSTFAYAYYYIDDIKLFEIENHFECGCLDENSTGYDWLADDPKSFLDYYNNYMNGLKESQMLLADLNSTNADNAYSSNSDGNSNNGDNTNHNDDDSLSGNYANSSDSLGNKSYGNDINSNSSNLGNNNTGNIGNQNGINSDSNNQANSNRTGNSTNADNADSLNSDGNSNNGDNTNHNDLLSGNYANSSDSLGNKSHGNDINSNSSNLGNNNTGNIGNQNGINNDSNNQANSNRTGNSTNADTNANCERDSLLNINNMETLNLNDISGEIRYGNLRDDELEIFNNMPDANTGDAFRLPNIYFAFNQAELLPSSYPSLELLGNVLKENSGLRIEIRGHTDNVGSSHYNRKLSVRRAESVYQFLIESGVDQARLKYRGFGNEVPIGDNETEFGRQMNRRVEIKVIENK